MRRPSSQNRSIGQPVATGAGAIPARPRMPDPIHGGMEGMDMESKHRLFSDRLRKLSLCAMEITACRDCNRCKGAHTPEQWRGA